MKERPILFSGGMVRAILAGEKTQTRRAIKPQPEYHGPEWGYGATDDEGDFWDVRDWQCPYGDAGDRLWIRETWATHATVATPVQGTPIFYRADIPAKDSRQSHHTWRPSIHMPRWASRLNVIIRATRAERLQDISVADAGAEGVAGWRDSLTESELHAAGLGLAEQMDPCLCYFALWDHINGKGSAAANPWVWVVEFVRVSTGEHR